MIQSNRRTFIKHSTLAFAALAVDGSVMAFGSGKKNKQLSFSTLGCPKWSLQKIIKFAATNNYQGVEIRTIQGELDLTKCPEFSASNISATKRMFADNNLEITDLGSSATMHFADKITRQKNMDEGKKFIDLAEKLDSPYIRVFPNNLPKNEDAKATLDIIIDGLNGLGNYFYITGGCLLLLAILPCLIIHTALYRL
jgi:sugar phosphate isomerase/epimerase